MENILLRSLLFVPGNRPDRIDKAFGAGADAVIIDLEDAVPISEKDRARQFAKEKAEQYSSEPVFVRINGLGTQFCAADIEAVVRKGLKGLMVPKVETPEDIDKAHELLADAEHKAGLKPGTISLIPLIESAAGVQNIYQILKSPSSSGRAIIVAFGAADYTLDLGIEMTLEGTELIYPRSRIAVACRAAGFPAPIDSPFMIDIRNIEALKADAMRARQLGFQGKLVIHPIQVGPCNEIFSPSKAELEMARNIVQAFESGLATGSGAIQLDGKFIDEPIVKRARQLVAMASKIEKKEDKRER